MFGVFFFCSSQSKIYRRAKRMFSAFIPSPLLFCWPHNLRSGSLIFVWKLLKLGLASGYFCAAGSYCICFTKHRRKTSLQCRRFLWSRNLLAKVPCWNFPKRGGDGASQRQRRGGGEGEEKTPARKHCKNEKHTALPGVSGKLRPKT